MWKLYAFLFLVLAIITAGIKVMGPTLAEEWLNRQGEGKRGYAFSIRDLDIDLARSQVVLNDVKVFNPKTSVELIKTPELTIQINVQDLIREQKNFVTLVAEKMDLILSDDLTAEIERIKQAGQSQEDLYVNGLEAKVAQLNIIEQKESISRTVLELSGVNFKVTEIGLHSVNAKTEFNLAAKLLDGGKLDLNGKTQADKWNIQGSLKEIPTDLFNKLAGHKLPFSFNESYLNAKISAQSENGRVTGEISPDIHKLNILVEKPGIPTQIIARLLNEELTFTLPFTVKNDVQLDYMDTFAKLKAYKRYPAETASTEPKQATSFWPF